VSPVGATVSHQAKSHIKSALLYGERSEIENRGGRRAGLGDHEAGHVPLVVCQYAGSPVVAVKQVVLMNGDPEV